MDIFVTYAKNVFGIDDKNHRYEVAEEAIRRTKQVFIDMGLTTTLREIGIKEKDNFEIMAEKAAVECKECFVPLLKEDIMFIYNQAF